MAGVTSGSANEGKSIKNECNDPKINAMALKKEYYQKTDSAAAKQVRTSSASVSQKNNEEKLPYDSEDIKSIQGLFFWKEIAEYHIPFIIRVISGEELKFVSVRMAETQLLNNYLHHLHAEILTYTSVRSYFITSSEAKLLNEINIIHSDGIYGKDTFYAGKDYIVHLEDVLEFYTFTKVCYNKILSNITPGCIEKKCGFICIDSEYVVPYCLKDGRKYLPLFYFEGEIEHLRQCAVKLENWNMAYIKFCCKVQGINKELYTFDSCEATTFDNIENNFPPETHFKEYWPAKVVNLQINQNSTHFHPSGIWIRAPSEVPAPENIISHSLTASAPVMPHSMPDVMNTFQNGWPPNQLGPQMSQGSSLMNDGSHVIPLPPINCANNTAPVISNTVSYSNTVPISQDMYNPVPSSSVMSHSNQMQQFYNHSFNNNSQAQQQQVQQHQQQQIITTPQVQPYSDSTSMLHSLLTNTQQLNAIRNVPSVVMTPATEIFDLSSPSSSPTSILVQYAPFCPNMEWKLKKIPEWTLKQDSTNNAAYQVQREKIERRLIHCINAKPYIYADFLVTLEDLILVQLFPCTISKCAYVLYKYLNITLFCGNSEQMNKLRENGRLRAIYAKDTPMVMLRDITYVLPQLKNLLSEQDEEFQSVAGPSKRHCTN